MNFDTGKFMPCPCGRPRIVKRADGRWQCGVCLRADSPTLWWEVLVHKATWTMEVASAYMGRVMAEEKARGDHCP